MGEENEYLILPSPLFAPLVLESLKATDEPLVCGFDIGTEVGYRSLLDLKDHLFDPQLSRRRRV